MVSKQKLYDAKKKEDKSFRNKQDWVRRKQEEEKKSRKIRKRVKTEDEQDKGKCSRKEYQKIWIQRKKEKIRESEENRKRKNREKVAKWRREKRKGADTAKTSTVEVEQQPAFKHREQRRRSVKRLRGGEEKEQNKKVEQIATYIKTLDHETKQALVARGILNREQQQIENEITNNIQESLQVLKAGRTKDARAAMQAIGTAVSTSSIKKSKSKVAKRLSINRKRISRGTALKRKCLADETTSLVATPMITRNVISKELKKAASDFWTRPGISRPTGNKNDIMKKRIGPKKYEENETLILEKSQTEVYEEFRQYLSSHQDLAKHKMMCQRTFESLRPYFVRSARPKDRQTCCCRSHVEMRSLFKATMEFRAMRCKNGKENVYKHLTDLCTASLCPKVNDEPFSKECLDRSCEQCGTDKISLMEEEQNDDKDSEGNPIHPCKWSRFEYTKLPNAKTKLMLITKVTTPKEMFSYMFTRLESFPAHQFRANWQRSQYDTLRENLPPGHIIAVHDFSENYRCTLFEEPQATYFDREEVTLHVTIIHRHRTEAEEKEEEATDEDQHGLITEEFFVISPDRSHDAHFVREVRRLMIRYLDDIDCKVDHLHEFTDGCSSQYKCRHTLGDLSYSTEDLGCQTHRNFFETAHAKGPQDAAGGLVKRKADSATMCSRSMVIQSAKDLFNFAVNHLSKPSSRSHSKRRVFRYIESAPKLSSRRFKRIIGIRKIHQVQSGETPKCVSTRELSCYSCDACLNMHSDNCENTAITGPLQIVTLKPETLEEQQEQESIQDTPEESEETLVDLVGKDSVVAVKADEEGESYYLIKVTSSGCYKARKDITDPWSGITFPHRSHIIRGFYYDRIGSGCKHTFQLNTSKSTVCPSSAIMYLLAVSATNQLELTDDEHAEIISN